MEPLTHLEVRLLQDAGELGGAVVLDLEAADVAQDLRHQLHVVVLHRLQLHLLLLLVSLREGEREGGRSAWGHAHFLTTEATPEEQQPVRDQPLDKQCDDCKLIATFMTSAAGEHSLLFLPLFFFRPGDEALHE